MESRQNVCSQARPRLSRRKSPRRSLSATAAAFIGAASGTSHPPRPPRPLRLVRIPRRQRPARLAVAAGVRPSTRTSPNSRTSKPRRKQAQTYNNFYELGTDKKRPRRKRRPLPAPPVGGCGGGRMRQAGRLRAGGPRGRIAPMEERTYRLRCVESVVHGHPLAGLSAEEPAGQS